MADAATLSVLIQAKDQASAAIKQVGNNMGGLASSFEKHRKTIGATMTVVGGAIAGVATMSIKAASDAQEMQNKFDVVFKGMTKEIEGWAASHAELIGRSRFDLMEYAANLQDTFVPMGIARDEASKLSRSIVELSVDLGSFNNLKTEDVVRDMTSAMIGNTESVLKYGVVIKAADLETEALNMGIIKSGEALDAASKAQTIYNLIVAGTTDAQGDAERSVGSFAAEMLRLQANMDEVKVLIGTALLPIITDLIEKVTPIVRGIKEWAEENPVLAERLFKVAAALGAIMLVVGPFLLVLPSLVAGIAILTGAFTALMTSMLPITLTILAIAAAITAGIVVWKNWETWSWKVKAGIAAVSVALFFILGPLALIPAAIIGIIAVIKNWDKIMEVAKKGIELMGKAIMGLAKFFLVAYKEILKFIPGMKDQKKAVDDAIKSVDKMSKSMDGWATRGSQAFSDVGSAASDSEREIAMAAVAVQEDMGGMGSSSSKAADEVKEAMGKTSEAVKGAAKSVKEETVVITAAMRGWGFEVDKATGIVEEMAVRTAKAVRVTADAFEEMGDVAMTVAQKVAQAEREKLAAISEANEKFLAESKDFSQQQQTIAEFNAGIDDFMSNQLIENMEEVHAARVTLTDSQIKELERGNRATEKAVAEREKIERDSIKRSTDAYEKFFKEQERQRIERGKTEKKAADEEQQRMVAKFKGTPQFKNMAAQQDKLRQVQSALESQKGALPGMREQVAQAKVGLEQYRDRGQPGEKQRAQIYWDAMVMPAQDAVQRQVERIGATEQQIQNLQNQIAKNVIPLEYKGLDLNVLSKEWLRPMQGGGIATGGLALVGERGPEVVSLPGGARVHPSGTGPGGQVNQFHFHGAVYGLEDLRRVVVESVRDHALSGGFRGVFGEA